MSLAMTLRSATSCGLFIKDRLMRHRLNKLANQQGLTLIELMIAMVIGTFLLLGAVTVYTQGRQNYQTE